MSLTHSRAAQRFGVVRGRVMQELTDILDKGWLHSVFLPIVDLEDRKVIGYEALARGPKGDFESPAGLFSAAYECGLLWKLERACIERALRGIEILRDEQKLFVNIEPFSVFDQDLFRKKVAAHASKIVFEITEHAAIDDFQSFREALKELRALGFQISIDGMGAGFAGLRFLSEIQPDYVKLDMGLIKGLEADPLKKTLVESIAGFARQAGVILIAEGLETLQEFKVLQDIGIRFVQGFIFGHATSDADVLRASERRMQELLGNLGWPGWCQLESKEPPSKQPQQIQ